MPEKYRRPPSRARPNCRTDATCAGCRTWCPGDRSPVQCRSFGQGLRLVLAEGRCGPCRETPVAVIACDSCGTVMDLDLRVKPRDPEASIRVALRDVRCPPCSRCARTAAVDLRQSQTHICKSDGRRSCVHPIGNLDIRSFLGVNASNELPNCDDIICCTQFSK